MRTTSPAPATSSAPANGLQASQPLMGSKRPASKNQRASPLKSLLAKTRTVGSAAWAPTRRLARRVWSGTNDEKAKVVLKPGVWHGLIHCSIHVIPLCAITVLSFLNFKGYFIGSNLQGLTEERYQDLSMLLLQITSKLLELLVVAAVGVIVMDVLRTQLLDQKGVPLGILASKSRFMELNYLISAEFRWGLYGYGSRRKGLAMGLLIFTSALIAVFIGPSAALLLIPSIRDDWPGGGATFWLAGSENSLWPNNLTAEHTGGNECQSPSIEALSSNSIDTAGCIWSGYSPILEAFKSRRTGNEITLPLREGTLRRDLELRSRPGVMETWTHTSYIAAGMMSQQLSGVCHQALIRNSKSDYLYTLRHRVRDATKAAIQSRIPVVRARCGTYAPASWNDGWILEYPFLPEYDVRTDLGLWLGTPTVGNISKIATQWVPFPRKLNMVDDSTTTDVPSAFLSVFVPDGDENNATSTGSIFACTVDARWTIGNNVASAVGFGDQDFVQTAKIINTRPFKQDYKGFELNFLPKNDSSWKRVTLGLDWLNTLTPNPDRNWTGGSTIARMLSELTSDLRKNEMLIESLVASTVVDGMARIGYKRNGVEAFKKNQPLLPTQWGEIDYHNILTSSMYAFPPPSDVAANDRTQLRWVVTVAGYAYRADSAAYYLALTVFFVYAALAIGHIIWTFWRGLVSDSWSSFISMVVLAQNSPPAPDVLSNAAVEMDNYKTMSISARICSVVDHVAAGVEDNRDSVQLLMGHRAETAMTTGYETLKKKNKYGTIGSP